MGAKVVVTVNPEISKYNPEMLREQMKKKPKSGVEVQHGKAATCFSTECYGRYITDYAVPAVPYDMELEDTELE